MIIKCFHEKTLFCNEQTGYTIASYKTSDASSVPYEARSKYRPRNGMTAFTAVGNHLSTAENVEVALSGGWVNGGKYGVQFSVDKCTVIRPKTTDGIIAYLSSNLIKGIGEKTARTIVERFGIHTLDILDSEPKCLLEVPGITEKKLNGILEGYKESTGLRNIMTGLAPYGVTPVALCQGLFNQKAKNNLPRNRK